MGSYGKNFEFRIIPETENRLARYVSPAAGTFVMGQGVQGTSTVDALGRNEFAAASTATPPIKGRSGIVIYEHGDGATWAGDDPNLTTYSDKSTIPHSKSCQVISGPNVKVVFRNTEDETFLQTRDYDGRNMVAETGATPHVSIGDYLEPHASPSDSNGYWRVTTTRANAWFVVVGRDTTRQEVEAQFLF